MGVLSIRTAHLLLNTAVIKYKLLFTNIVSAGDHAAGSLISGSSG